MAQPATRLRAGVLVARSGPLPLVKDGTSLTLVTVIVSKQSGVGVSNGHGDKGCSKLIGRRGDQDRPGGAAAAKGYIAIGNKGGIARGA